MDETMFEIGMRTHKLMVEQLKERKDEQGKWVAMCMHCEGTGLTHTKSYADPEFEIVMTGYEEIAYRIGDLKVKLDDQSEFISAMPTMAFLIMLAEAGLNLTLEDLKKTDVYRDYEENL